MQTNNRVLSQFDIQSLLVEGCTFTGVRGLFGSASPALIQPSTTELYFCSRSSRFGFDRRQHSDPKQVRFWYSASGPND